MKKLISLFLALQLYIAPSFAQDYPRHVEEFAQNVLNDYLTPLTSVDNQRPYRLQFEQDGEISQLTLEILIPQPSQRRSDWNVYSRYRFLFAPSEEQPLSPPHVRVHRMRDRNGNHVGPALEGEIEIAYQESGLSAETKNLQNLVRSLFRADQTLHPLYRNPLAQQNETGLTLTPPQRETLFGNQQADGQRPGLLNFYMDHQNTQPDQPMQALLMLPTGIGKTIVALRYLELLSQTNNNQVPMGVFVVENTGILRDFTAKIQSFFPNLNVARLFGNSASMAIDPEARFVVVTRSTFFRRRDEILAHVGRYQGPKVIFRDEAHHTGRIAGQFEAILEMIMQAFRGDTQIIDMTASPWHEDDPRLIRRYEGRVATSFVTQNEYNLLREGNEVDKVARIQLVQAILQGWLSPLTNLTFMTGRTHNDEGMTYRQQLIAEQNSLVERLGLEGTEVTQRRLEELTEAEVIALREEIQRVHSPIVEELYRDLRHQFLRDRNGRVAEYDRGLIFVPTIAHAEIYQILLNDLASSQNMEFRVVHSRQSSGRIDVAAENIDWFGSDERPHQHRYLISVQMLREGIDLPNANRLVFATFSDSIKILLQVLGRGTRVAMLKSGIRLTDMGGSYLKFFQELPGTMLNRLFPIHQRLLGQNQGRFMDLGLENGNARKPLVIDGEEMSVDELQRIRVTDAMEGLVDTGLADSSSFTADGVRLSSHTLELLNRLEQHSEDFAWSVLIDPPSQEQVNQWVHLLVQSISSESLPPSRNRNNENREAQVSRFAIYNFRWLSLPWQYLMNDITVESPFFSGRRHPLHETYEYLQDNDNKAFLQGQGYRTPLDAILAGHLDFLPETLRVPFRVVPLNPEYKSVFRALVKTMSLLGSRQGRALIGQSPERAEFLSTIKWVNQLMGSGAFSGGSDTYTFDFMDSNRYMSNNEQRNPWTNDFRYAQIDSRALTMLNDNNEVSEPIRELRHRSLLVGMPFSGIEERGELNLLRMASLARNISQRTDEGRRLFHRFAQPRLNQWEARILGGPRRGGWATNQMGLIPLFYTNDEYNQLTESDMETGFYDSFERTSLDLIEFKLMTEAFIVENFESGQLSKAQAESYFEIKNRPAYRRIQERTLRPLLLEDLIANADQTMIDIYQRDEGIRFLMLQRASQSAVLPETDLFSIDGSLQVDVFGDIDSSSPVELSRRPSTSSLIWYDYIYRIAFNTDLYVESAEQQHIARILDVLGQSLNFSSPVLPERWANQADLLLQVIPDEDLPWSMERISGNRFNGLFRTTRFFMVLPFYFAIHYLGDATVFRGIGDTRNQRLVAWAERFGVKYQEELRQINFESFLDIQEPVLQAALEITRAHHAHPTTHRVFIYDVVISGERGERRRAALDQAESQIRERYSEDIYRRAKNLIYRYGARSFNQTRSIESFRSSVYHAIFEKEFVERASDSNLLLGKQHITAWDRMAYELARIELGRIAESIRNQPQSILMRPVMITTPDDDSFSDSDERVGINEGVPSAGGLICTQLF
jgi:superfamily II DNA or RNA helicase